MNIMNAGKGRKLAQIRGVAAKKGPETEHPIKIKEVRPWTLSQSMGMLPQIPFGGLTEY